MDISWLQQRTQDMHNGVKLDLLAAEYNKAHPQQPLSSATLRRRMNEYAPGHKPDSSRPPLKIDRNLMSAHLATLPAGKMRCTELADLTEDNQRIEVHTTTVWKAVREVAPERLAPQRGGRRKKPSVNGAQPR